MDIRRCFPGWRRGQGIIGLLRLYGALLLLLPALPLSFFWLGSAFGVAPRTLGWLLAGGFAIAVPLAAAVGQSIARSILAPLKLLLAGADMIQEGEFGHVIDLELAADAPLEFKQLMRAFNRMSTTVSRHVQTIEATSRTDQLTGMCNRRHLMAEGYRLLGVALRAGRPCSCLMLDIDLFKQVNDTYGHPIGDKYLIHIASCIASTIRESDMAARYGGEEFVILAPNASLAEARTLAERIRALVAARPLVIPGAVIANTVSVGVAEYDPEPQFGANVLEDMIEKADRALYRAKQCGRNRVECWPVPETPAACP